MSDSESDQPLVASRPSDTTLTQALRDVVAGIFKSGKVEELTVKRVRLAAEKKLGIEEGFFKDDGDWKKRSDQIIKEEAVSGMSVVFRFYGVYLMANAIWMPYRKRETGVLKNQRLKSQKNRLNLLQSLPRQSAQGRGRHPNHGSAKRQRLQSQIMKRKVRAKQRK